MAKSIHLPCKNKPLHTAECSECGQIESRVAAVEEKLDTIQEGAEVNVQADWNEADPTSDSYILNKPNITPNTVDSELSATSTNPVQNRIITGALASKQDTLVSGTNIKTVNGNSLLGSGDITIQGGGIVVLSVESFSSLPQTVSDAIITADMICLKAELGTPSAQTGNWTVTTASGSLTIAGTISGSTTATLYLARKEN